MKKHLAITILAAVSVFALNSGCGDESETSVPSRDFRSDMRSFVQAISNYANQISTEFIVIPQNGIELITRSGEEDDTLMTEYLLAIDGVGQEDLYYGYLSDNTPTPASESAYLAAFLDRAESVGVEVLVTDYCESPEFVDDSYARSESRGFISFAADHRDLDNIPAYPATPFHANGDPVGSLSDARNFLYLIDPSSLGDRQSFLTALAATDYDVLILDLFFEDSALTPTELGPLKTKTNGAARLVVCYMSIGEAEDYRYYWQADWRPGNPGWISGENPNWEGNYKVHYWNPEWQAIVFGDGSSYTKMIIDAGFDGVYLDIIDAFEYFENQ